jgi:octaprenyl-diphosphate synthase
MAKSATEHKSEPLNPLEDLAAYLSQDMEEVNTTILNKMSSQVPLINQVSTYLIAAGGKRIRPLLTLATAKALNGNMKRAHGLAATVEFIHTATLLHDDVVDDSHERRGKKSANDVFGNEASVLVGDFLFSRAFQLMVADGSMETLRILSDASAIISEGEVLQLQMQGNPDTTWEQYLHMIGAKTAALFAAACEVGAVVANADPQTQKTARLFGYNLGIAFQIADDLLDYSSGPGALGKEAGDDFREGKITAPFILAYHDAEQEEKEFWLRTVARGQQRAGDFAHAQNILNHHKIIERGLQEAGRYADQARDNLAGWHETDVTKLLSTLTEYVVARSS